MKFRYGIGICMLLSMTSVFAGSNPASKAYVDNAIQDAAFSYKIGDVVQGSVVFWLDATKQHGLAVAAENANGG